MINFSKRSIQLSLALLLTVSASNISIPAALAKTAAPVSVKIGYFNLALVKASYPESAGSDMLKNQAESQLRRDLDEANKQIMKMQDEKKSTEDIQKAVRDNQLSINAKQQALQQLIQTQSALAREKIMQATNQVCRDKNLDLAIDGEGLFVGGKTVLDNGVDITEDIVKVLTPSAGGAPAPAAGGGRK
jgi:Skp family chaperone for outer membrane proteins